MQLGYARREGRQACIGQAAKLGEAPLRPKGSRQTTGESQYRHEVALPYLGERVQPCAREQGQPEKNGRPVQADCQAVQVGAPRVYGWLLSRGAAAQWRNVDLTRTPLVNKGTVRIPSLRVSIFDESNTARYPAFIPVYVNRFVQRVSHGDRQSVTMLLAAKFQLYRSRLQWGL
jgi:hypothetical protein